MTELVLIFGTLGISLFVSVAVAAFAAAMRPRSA